MTELFSQPSGASPISDEQKEGLLQKWISSQSQLNRIEKDNILLGQQWLFNNRQKKADFADFSFLSRLHKKMFNNVYSWAGHIRTIQSNIGDSPHLIRQNVYSLKLDIHAWIENKCFSQDEIAIRYHHLLVCIHPFDNGNGRLSRLMADYINEQIFDNQPFSWGAEDLYANGTARRKYLQAIYDANDNKIDNLVAFARG